MRADPPMRPFHEEDWESKLRPKPNAAAVLATLASGGDDAVAERWGGRRASELIRAATRRPRFGAAS